MKIFPTTLNKINHKSNFLNNFRFGVIFKGTPEVMPASYDSIDNYKKLANGSYLDIHDDAFAPENKKIRDRNLSFLDQITSESEKRRFINYYKNFTGFPDLKKVSDNIEREFIYSIRRTSDSFDDYKYNVLAAGYDGTCSVGKGMALPGSDIDKAFIILKGDIYGVWGADKDSEIVNEFKGRLWDKTDQRILSYNHDTSFPTVMTVNQIYAMLGSLNRVTQQMSFDRVQMGVNVQKEYLDLIKAADFNIKVSERIPKRYYDDSGDAFNRENVKNFSYFIESVRDGKKLITSPEFEQLKDAIQDYDFYKYSNVAQMQAMRNAVSAGKEKKNKIMLRRSLDSDFNTWSTDKQFDFIKTLIKYTCEDQQDFMEYFQNDRNIKEKYQPLLGLLCFGDKNRRINPDFHIYPSKIDIYLSPASPVELYQGSNKETLWINSKDSNIVEDVLLYADRLRKTALFRFINKVQAPLPKDYIMPFKFRITDISRGIIERGLR